MRQCIGVVDQVGEIVRCQGCLRKRDPRASGKGRLSAVSEKVGLDSASKEWVRLSVLLTVSLRGSAFQGSCQAEECPDEAKRAAARTRLFEAARAARPEEGARGGPRLEQCVDERQDGGLLAHHDEDGEQQKHDHDGS